MTTPIRCDDLLEALDDYALDRLPRERRDAVLHHVAVCPECAQEASRLNDLWAQLALVAEPEAVNAVRCSGIRERLMARAMADREIGAAGASVVPISSARSAPAAAAMERDEARAERHAPERTGEHRPSPPSARWGLVVAIIVAFVLGALVGELIGW